MEGSGFVGTHRNVAFTQEVINTVCDWTMSLLTGAGQKPGSMAIVADRFCEEWQP
jgi:hypothetical protein